MAATLLVPPSWAEAQAAGPVRTEAEVVAAVREANLALRAARTGALADAEQPAQVRWPFPMVELMPMPAMIADGQAGAQIMARQMIPPRGRLAADRAARAGMAAASGLEAEALGLELVRLARTTYAELWGNQEQGSLIGEYIARLAVYREAALAQYAAGRGPQQAVLGIQVEAELLEQRLESLAEDRAALAARITALTGGRVVLGDGHTLAAPATAGVVADPAADRAAAEDHPRIDAGRAMQAAEAASVELRRTMLRPELTLGLNLNLSRDAFERMYGQEPVMPAIGISLPLWRGAVRSEIREAELRVGQRELETEDVRLALEAELEDAHAQLARVRERIGRFEDRLRPQVRQTLEASLAGYRVGATRFLELLDAQRMALEVETELIDARVREASLIARLDAAAGRQPATTE
jgi:outer membrane protein TolC